MSSRRRRHKRRKRRHDDTSSDSDSTESSSSDYSSDESSTDSDSSNSDSSSDSDYSSSDSSSTSSSSSSSYARKRRRRKRKKRKEKKRKDESDDEGNDKDRDKEDVKDQDSDDDAKKKKKKKVGKWYCKLDRSQGGKTKYDKKTCKQIEKAYFKKRVKRISLKHGWFANRRGAYEIRFDRKRRPIYVYQVNLRTKFKREVVRKPAFSDGEDSDDEHRRKRSKRRGKKGKKAGDDQKDEESNKEVKIALEKGSKPYMRLLYQFHKDFQYLSAEELMTMKLKDACCSICMDQFNAAVEVIDVYDDGSTKSKSESPKPKKQKPKSKAKPKPQEDDMDIDVTTFDMSKFKDRKKGEQNSDDERLLQSDTLASMANEDLDAVLISPIKRKSDPKNEDKSEDKIAVEKEKVKEKEKKKVKHMDVKELCKYNLAISLNQCQTEFHGKHYFHMDCLLQVFYNMSNSFQKMSCPVCKVQYEKILIGNQPKGSMSVKKIKYACSGYDKYRTLQIDFRFPDGTQNETHPNPGKKYPGEHRVGFLPNNKQGKLVAKLVRIAFDRKLMFTIGKSISRDMDNVIIWNGVEMKTRLSGGKEVYGYPDRKYFKQVLKQLAEKGVTEKDLEEN